MGKLIKDPSYFDNIACVREISRINLEAIDLMHFPIVENNHWALACINSLYSTLNFFDSASQTSEKREKQIILNLTTNLRTVFNHLGIQCKDFEKFKKYNAPDYPHQQNGYDCGFYVMLFMEHWNGKTVKDFSNIIILKYRMVMAYKMFHSDHNRVDKMKLESIKKKKF